MSEMKCTSCGTDLLGDNQYSRFLCPKCGEEEIFRCSKCRSFSNTYKCKKCGFEGP